MANNFFAAVIVSGGGAGALDDINHNSIADGDGAIVIDAVNNYAYFYTYDSSSSDAESSPDIINPDSNSGDGRWILTTSQSLNSFWRDLTAVTTLSGFLSQLGVQYDYLFIPAGAMDSLTTNGAAASVNEYATNDIMMRYLAFDGATEQFAAFSLPMPATWDRSTIRAKFYWAPASGASSGDTVEWELAAGALSNDDAIDAALGTSQVISDTVTAGEDGDLHITARTPAITVGGTPALGDLIHFKVSRNVGGTDDMTEDAWLFGIVIEFANTNTVTAWS